MKLSKLTLALLALSGIASATTIPSCPTGQSYIYTLATDTLSCSGTVTPPPPPPPPPATSPNFCGANDRIINVGWPATGQVRLQSTSFSTGIVAFKITVPAVFNPPLVVSHTGFMRIAEVPGTPTTFREMTLSKSSCDFQSGKYLYNGIGNPDIGPSVSYTVNFLGAPGYNPNLSSGDVVFFNVRNRFNNVNSCTDAPLCNVLFDFATPNRY